MVAIAEVARADAEPFTGFQCDRIGCTARINGSTSTRDRIVALTHRAEAGGWQCLHINGAAMHLCPDHTDESLPPRRKLYEGRR